MRVKDKFVELIFANRKHIIGGALALIVLCIVAAVLIIRANPGGMKSYNSLAYTGIMYEQKGKMLPAIAFYRKLVRLYPDRYGGHILLGRAYKKVNELEKAKVEFYRADQIGNSTHEAEFEMADVYLRQKDFDLAEAAVEGVKKSLLKADMMQLGMFYLKMARIEAKTNVPQAIRIIKQSYVYFDKAGKKYSDMAKEEMANYYADIADALLSVKSKDNAIEVLNTSLSYYDNPKILYKLGLIYSDTDPEKAISYFEQAFSKNDKAGEKDPYILLILKKADRFHSEGKEKIASFYYSKAYSLNPSKKPFFSNQKNVFVNIIGVRYSQDIQNDRLTPGIIFRVMNFEKNDIKNLNAKVVFLEGEVLLDEQIMEIASSEKPLETMNATIPISLSSDNSINNLLSDHEIKIEIYLSSGDNWRLSRVAGINWNKDKLYNKN